MSITADKLAAAKQRLNEFHGLTRELISAREQASHATFSLDQTEACFDNTSVQIRNLESFTVEGLLESFLWRKAGKLAALKDELSRLEKDLASREQELLVRSEALAQLEARIAELDGVDAAYKSAFDNRCAEILSRSGDANRRLTAVNTNLDIAKAQRQKLRTARQVANHLLERVHTLTKSRGRARQRLLPAAAGGILVAAAVNAVHRYGASSSTTRVSEGIDELRRTLAGIPLENGSQRDQLLFRLTDELNGMRDQVGTGLSSNAASSHLATMIAEHIHQILPIIEAMNDECEANIRGLDKQRTQLVENA